MQLQFVEVFARLCSLVFELFEVFVQLQPDLFVVLLLLIQ